MEREPQIEKAHQILRDVHAKLRAGADYKVCREEAQPAIDVLNIKGEEIAKRFNRRYKKITFIGLMRGNLPF